MNFLEHTNAAMGMVVDALDKPPVFRPDPTLGTLVLRWDGVDRLTVDGQRHFAIYVETRAALAEAIFRLACPEETVTEAEVDRFCTDVLAPLDEGRGKAWTCCSDAVSAWLRRVRA